MANAQKPTSRTRHMEVRYYALAEWVERDLLRLARVDTSSNVADNFTKALLRILFQRHADVSLGHIPPSYSPIARQRVGETNSDQRSKPTGLYDIDPNPKAAAAATVEAPPFS